MTCGMAGGPARRCLARCQPSFPSPRYPLRVPGCIVESMTFFAFHSSGVISCIFPVLYAVTICFASSRPAEEVNRVLRSRLGQWCGLKRCWTVIACQKMYMEICVHNETSNQRSWTHHFPHVQRQNNHCAAVSPRV